MTGLPLPDGQRRPDPPPQDADGPSVDLLRQVRDAMYRWAAEDLAQPRAVLGAPGAARVRRYVLQDPRRAP